jgi:hypothetical protein
MFHNERLGRAPKAFANILREANTKLKAWPSKPGDGYDADIIL